MSKDDPRLPMAQLPEPDAHGHAALLLVESVIHKLLESSVINVGDAIEIVEVAESVQAEYAEAADGDGATMLKSRMLLSAIAESLKRDAADRSPPIPRIP